MKNRSLRLHKKLYTGPFKVEGFHFEVLMLSLPTLDEELDRHEDIWDQYIDHRGISGCTTGGKGPVDGTEQSGGYICGYGRYESASEQDREALYDWLTSRDDVMSFCIGPLVDAWHESHDEFENWKDKECLIWGRD